MSKAACTNCLPDSSPQRGVGPWAKAVVNSRRTFIWVCPPVFFLFSETGSRCALVWVETKAAFPASDRTGGQCSIGHRLGKQSCEGPGALHCKLWDRLPYRQALPVTEPYRKRCIIIWVWVRRIYCPLRIYKPRKASHGLPFKSDFLFVHCHSL